MCGVNDGSLTLLSDDDNEGQSDFCQLQCTTRKIKFGRDEQVCHTQKQLFNEETVEECPSIENSAPATLQMTVQCAEGCK